jgi:thiol-disulfide isomerase/thioredoxin
MRLPRSPVTIVLFPALIAALALPRNAPGQSERPDQAGAPGPAQAAPSQTEESVRTINDEYDRKLLELDRQRLERLGRLGARQKPADAAATYEQLFRLAIAGNLFRDAETAADTVVKDGSPSPTTLALAHLVRIIARADRGAYEDSLDCLRQALALRGKEGQPDAPRSNLGAGELVGICEAYYQRLVHGGQFEVARKAFRLALDEARLPAVTEFLRSRLGRIDRVGKPAPPVRGTDIDGKPFDLADSKGKVVLVVFWASWCLPCASEIPWLDQAYDLYRGRGLQMVGINVDALQDGGQKPETVLPNVLRFLIDHNVRWPTLLNGAGDRDYAKAYGITDIPANVLVDRQGNVVQVDLVRQNFEAVLSRVLGP